MQTMRDLIMMRTTRFNFNSSKIEIKHKTFIHFNKIFEKKTLIFLNKFQQFFMILVNNYTYINELESTKTLRKLNLNKLEFHSHSRFNNHFSFISPSKYSHRPNTKKTPTKQKLWRKKKNKNGLPTYRLFSSPY